MTAVQAGAESIMRNVAKRMLNAELSSAVITWHQGLLEHRSQQRGERIMKRVGARWMNRELSDNFREWREKQTEEKMEKNNM